MARGLSRRFRFLWLAGIILVVVALYVVQAAEVEGIHHELVQNEVIGDDGRPELLMSPAAGLITRGKSRFLLTSSYYGGYKGHCNVEVCQREERADGRGPRYGKVGCCNNQCIDLFHDTRHCGACGRRCGPVDVCCEGTCRNIYGSDRNNCGGCFNRCGYGVRCMFGMCGYNSGGGGGGGHRPPLSPPPGRKSPPPNRGGGRPPKTNPAPKPKPRPRKPKPPPGRHHHPKPPSRHHPKPPSRHHPKPPSRHHPKPPSRHHPKPPSGIDRNLALGIIRNLRLGINPARGLDMVEDIIITTTDRPAAAGPGGTVTAEVLRPTTILEHLALGVVHHHQVVRRRSQHLLHPGSLVGRVDHDHHLAILDTVTQFIAGLVVTALMAAHLAIPSRSLTTLMAGGRKQYLQHFIRSRI